MPVASSQRWKLKNIWELGKSECAVLLVKLLMIETVFDSGPTFQMSLKEHYVLLITEERID